MDIKLLRYPTTQPLPHPMPPQEGLGSPAAGFTHHFLCSCSWATPTPAAQAGPLNLLLPLPVWLCPQTSTGWLIQVSQLTYHPLSLKGTWAPKLKQNSLPLSFLSHCFFSVYYHLKLSCLFSWLVSCLAPLLDYEGRILTGLFTVNLQYLDWDLAHS